MRKPSEVLDEARKDIRTAINAAMAKIKIETGLTPSEIDIRVEVISTGPTHHSMRGEMILGQVDINFRF